MTCNWSTTITPPPASRLARNLAARLLVSLAVAKLSPVGWHFVIPQPALQDGDDMCSTRRTGYGLGFQSNSLL